jgi:hypothetical protein
MSTLDEITKEKQRVSEALARVDVQREKLTGQLSELEATYLFRLTSDERSGVAAIAAVVWPACPIIRRAGRQLPVQRA